MKHHREIPWYPKDINHLKYMEDWWAWWLLCQPDWRSTQSETGDMSDLQISGPNGFLVFIIGLALWHVTAPPSAATLEWSRAVADLQWAVDRL